MLLADEINWRQIVFKGSEEQHIVIAETSSNYEVYRFNNMAMECKNSITITYIKNRSPVLKKLAIPVAMGGFYLLLNKWKIHADKTINKEPGNQTISFCLIWC